MGGQDNLGPDQRSRSAFSEIQEHHWFAHLLDILTTSRTPRLWCDAVFVSDRLWIICLSLISSVSVFLISDVQA